MYNKISPNLYNTLYKAYSRINYCCVSPTFIGLLIEEDRSKVKYCRLKWVVFFYNKCIYKKFHISFFISNQDAFQIAENIDLMVSS